MTQALRTDCEGFYRRDFLTVGAVGLIGLTLPGVLRQEARATTSRRRPGARGVIVIWLGGGPATIDMWDLKPQAPDYIRGEFRSIATCAAGLRISEHLPNLARVMDRCLLVRSLHHNIPAHGPGTVYMSTGHPPAAALDYPSLGALASRLLPAAQGVPAYVQFQRAAGFAGGAGYLGTGYNPFEVDAGPRGQRPQLDGISLPDGFTVAQLESRDRLRARFDNHFRALDDGDVPSSLDRFQQQALDILRSDRTRQAFHLDREPASVRENYGLSPLGQSLLTARRLLEAGARFITVGLGGWDTHGNNFATLRNQLLPTLDRALAALVTDLSARRLLDSTIVYCAGEFGRTPRINGAAGRDHWARAMAVLLAGGGFRGGLAYGSTDRLGSAPERDPCGPADVSASIFRALGVAPTQELQTTSGRRMPLFRDGRVIEGLFGG
jgi:hypothetical protein